MKTIKQFAGFLLIGLGITSAISAKTFDVSLINLSNGDMTVQGAAGTFTPQSPQKNDPVSGIFTISDGQSRSFLVQTGVLSKNDTQIKVKLNNYANKTYTITFKSKWSNTENKPATITFRPKSTTGDQTKLRLDVDKVNIDY